MIASTEKFVMDCGFLQLLKLYFEPCIRIAGQDKFALGAMREGGRSVPLFESRMIGSDMRPLSINHLPQTGKLRGMVSS